MPFNYEYEKYLCDKEHIKENVEKSYVFLKGVSKVSGDIQWYVSVKKYDISEAEKLFDEENFKDIFKMGVRISNVTRWA